MTESSPPTPMPDLDLLVVGDINADVLVSDPALAVEFGQVERVVPHAGLTVGGSAAITAIGAARLGVRTGIVGVVGGDALGDLLLAQLRAGGVDVDLVRIDPARATGLSVILDRGGDRAILTGLGTISDVSPSDLQAVPHGLARHVHVSSYFLMNDEYRATLPGWLAEVREHGASTSVDTNWDPDLRWDIEDLLRSCDWYFPNEAELEASTGTSVLNRSLEVIAELGAQVAVKRGSNGALARTDDRMYRVRRTPPVDFVDAVGAGDTFDAGFLAGMLSGVDVGRCLAMGVTAGTLSTAGSGGTSAHLDRDGVELLAARLPVETESL